MVRTLKEIQQQWEEDRSLAGYREVPNYPRYEVNMYGEVKRKEGRKPLKQILSYKGLYVIMTNNDGQSIVYLNEIMRDVYPTRQFQDSFLEESPKTAKPRVTATNQDHIPEIPDEQWKTIPEFPNYEISDHGRVKFSSTGRFLKIVPKLPLAKGGKGYRRSHDLLMNNIWGELRKDNRGSQE